MNILDQLKAFQAALAPHTGPKTQILLNNINATIAAAEDASDEIAADLANFAIGAAAAKFPVMGFLVPLEGPLIDPVVTKIADSFKGFFIQKVMPQIQLGTPQQINPVTGNSNG